MATVYVFSHGDVCGAEEPTGVTFSNGDTLTISVDPEATWYTITNGFPGCDSVTYATADGALCAGDVYDSCDGLTVTFGMLCGKLGSLYFPVGISYSEVVAGLSGAEELYLYQHATWENNEVAQGLPVEISEPSGGGPTTNAIMFSCNT